MNTCKPLIAGVFALWVTAAGAQASAPDAKTLARIATFMNMPQEKLMQAYSRRPLEIALPFAPGTAADAISLQHDLAMPQRKQPMPAFSYFAADGRWLATESAHKITDPRRMSMSDVEKVMRNNHSHVHARLPLDDRALLDKLWEAVARRVDLTQVLEFNVSYVEFEFHNGARRPAFIVHIWGPDNPLFMPDDFPPVLKNRIRLVYDPRSGDLYADNML